MSAVGFVAFCVANATARVARRTHFSWLTLRYTSKLAHSAITLAWLATNPIFGRVGALCTAKTYATARFFVASAVGFVAFCVANATARIAHRTHFSWLTRLLKRHCGDDNKQVYCHKTHLFSQSLTATPITAIKSNEIENQTIVPLNCRLGVIAITLVLLATNPNCGRGGMFFAPQRLTPPLFYGGKRWNIHLKIKGIYAMVRPNHETDMESKRHQKLYEHYTNYFGTRAEVWS